MIFNILSVKSSDSNTNMMHQKQKKSRFFHQIKLFLHHTRMSATIEVQGEDVTTT